MPIKVLEMGFRVDSFEFWESRLKVWQLVNIAPIAWSRGSMELEYFKDLINL